VPVPRDSARRLGRNREARAGRALRRLHPTRCHDPSISYGRISNLIGYVRVDSFEFAPPGAGDDDTRLLEADLDGMIREFDFVESVVVDLRFNFGGFGDSLIALASRFMPEGPAEVAAILRTDPNDLGARSSPEAARADAQDHPRFRKRLFLLTSRWTTSAGEMFGLALLDREPKVVRIGESTQGAFCLTSRRLPNGWRVR
jgi:C-terminal processing protease CtpA/Prc